MNGAIAATIVAALTKRFKKLDSNSGGKLRLDELKNAGR